MAKVIGDQERGREAIVVTLMQRTGAQRRFAERDADAILSALSAVGLGVGAAGSRRETGEGCRSLIMASTGPQELLAETFREWEQDHDAAPYVGDSEDILADLAVKAIEESDEWCIVWTNPEGITT